jgi:hypothetical protein
MLAAGDRDSLGAPAVTISRAGFFFRWLCLLEVHLE